jgi:endonuclease G
MKYLLAVLVAVCFLPFVSCGEDGALYAYLPGLQTVERKGLLIAFDAARKIPRVVIYRIDPAKPGAPEASRAGLKFRRDPLVPSSPDPRDYLKSGYDLGHMCPADDKDVSAEAMADTFATSNCAPQLPALNRGDWRELEAILHKETLARGPPYFVIVCGPVFRSASPKTIGSGIAVPDAFFKLAYSSDGSVRAWLFPNTPGPNRSASDYEVPVWMIEELTGFLFASPP